MTDDDVRNMPETSGLAQEEFVAWIPSRQEAAAIITGSITCITLHRQSALA
jgi:hypothetical protein